MTVSATHDASDAATAASAALPPARRISTPASAVCGCPAATPATGSSAAAARNHPADADEARLEELDEQPFLVAVRNAEDAVARRGGDRRDGLVRVGDLDCEAAVRHDREERLEAGHRAAVLQDSPPADVAKADPEPVPPLGRRDLRRGHGLERLPRERAGASEQVLGEGEEVGHVRVEAAAAPARSRVVERGVAVE